MKSVKRSKIAKRFICSMIACMLTCTAFGIQGCGLPGLSLRSGGNSTSYIFRVGEEKCTEQEARIILMNFQKEYSSLYGIDMWSGDYSAKGSLEDYVKNITLTQLAEVYTMDVIAQNRGVSLSGSEKQKSGQAAKEFMNGLSDEEKEYLSASANDVEALFMHYALAMKVYEDVTSEVNKEVSDNEACVMEVQQVRIAEKEVADEVFEKLKGGTDIYSLPSEYKDVDVEDRNITRTTFDSAYEESIFSLNTGEYSGIIDMGDAYYIFYCVNSFNSELTDKNKESVLADRIQSAMEQTYASYADELSSSLNENVWDEIYVDSSLELSGASFMEVYRSYFGNFE